MESFDATSSFDALMKFWRGVMRGGSGSPRNPWADAFGWNGPAPFAAPRDFDPAHFFATIFRTWPPEAPHCDAHESAHASVTEWLQGLVDAISTAANTMSAQTQEPQWPPFGNADWWSMDKAWSPSDFGAAFNVPPMGLTREWETKWRNYYGALKEETSARAQFARQLAWVYQSALQRMVDELQRGGSDDRVITTVRELYDFWIDIAEECYNERAMSDEYARVFARVVNAHAATQKAWRMLMEAFQTASNQPTQTDFQQIVARLQAIEKRLAADNAAHRESNGAREHQEKILALEKRLDALSRPPSNDTDSAARTAAKRRSSRKPRKDDGDGKRPKQRDDISVPRAAKVTTSPRKKPVSEFNIDSFLNKA